MVNAHSRIDMKHTGIDCFVKLQVVCLIDIARYCCLRRYLCCFFCRRAGSNHYYKQAKDNTCCNPRQADLKHLHFRQILGIQLVQNENSAPC